MTDIAKLEQDIDLLEARLIRMLQGIHGLSAQPVVKDGILPLIDARIALALANRTLPIAAALEALVDACEGEPEEVFAGEIGTALAQARAELASKDLKSTK